MRILYLLSLINIALIITSCSTLTDTEPTAERDPTAIKMVAKPDKPYRVVGKATVSKFNAVGIKRQEATVRDVMRQIAANMKGDAITSIKNHPDSFSADIIAFA